MSETRFDILLISREGVSRYDGIRGADVTEELRQIGLEWKCSDWPHKQAVTISVVPVSEESKSPIKESKPSEQQVEPGPCPRCDGEGVLGPAMPDDLCPTCKGSGYVDDLETASSELEDMTEQESNESLSRDKAAAESRLARLEKAALKVRGRADYLRYVWDNSTPGKEEIEAIVRSIAEVVAEFDAARAALKPRPEIAENLIRGGKNSVSLALQALTHSTPPSEEKIDE
jgi:hypothetical protein